MNFDFSQFQTKPGMIDPMAVLYGHGNFNEAMPYTGPGWKPDWGGGIPGGTPGAFDPGFTPAPTPPPSMSIDDSSWTGGPQTADPHDGGGGGGADANAWGGGGTDMGTDPGKHGSLGDISGIGSWLGNPANYGAIGSTLGGLAGMAIPGPGGLLAGTVGGLIGNSFARDSLNNNLTDRGVPGQLSFSDVLGSTIAGMGFGLGGALTGARGMGQRQEDIRRDYLAQGYMGRNMEGPQGPASMDLMGNLDETGRTILDNPEIFGLNAVSLPSAAPTAAAAPPAFDPVSLGLGYGGAPGSMGAMGAPEGQTGYASGTYGSGVGVGESGIGVDSNSTTDGGATTGGVDTSGAGGQGYGGNSNDGRDIGW